MLVYLRPSFVGESRRIAEPDYVPTTADVRRIKIEMPEVFEKKVGHDIIRIHNPGDKLLERTEFLPMLEDSFGILFYVDLLCYDQVVGEEPSQSLLMDTLAQFSLVVNSQSFSRKPTSITLGLWNFDKFEEKIGRCPLSSCFTDFDGGNNVSKSLRYILNLFRQVTPWPKRLIPLNVRNMNGSIVESMEIVLAHFTLTHLCENTPIL